MTGKHYMQVKVEAKRWFKHPTLGVFQKGQMRWVPEGEVAGMMVRELIRIIEIGEIEQCKLNTL